MGGDGGGDPDARDPVAKRGVRPARSTADGPVSGARAAPAGKGLDARALQRALDFIDRHLGQHLSLEQLARSVPISRYHFARRFRCSTGLSPMVYLMHARIERAIQRIGMHDGSMADMASELGFSDQSHFTRVFRKIVGSTPGAYARRQACAFLPRERHGPVATRNGPVSARNAISGVALQTNPLSRNERRERALCRTRIAVPN